MYQWSYPQISGYTATRKWGIECTCVWLWSWKCCRIHTKSQAIAFDQEKWLAIGPVNRQHTAAAAEKCVNLARQSTGPPESKSWIDARTTRCSIPRRRPPSTCEEAPGRSTLKSWPMSAGVGNDKIPWRVCKICSQSEKNEPRRPLRFYPAPLMCWILNGLSINCREQEMMMVYHEKTFRWKMYSPEIISHWSSFRRTWTFHQITNQTLWYRYRI
jgi:hypothetical protein